MLKRILNVEFLGHFVDQWFLFNPYSFFLLLSLSVMDTTSVRIIIHGVYPFSFPTLLVKFMNLSLPFSIFCF